MLGKAPQQLSCLDNTTEELEEGDSTKNQTTTSKKLNITTTNAMIISAPQKNYPKKMRTKPKKPMNQKSNKNN